MEKQKYYINVANGEISHRKHDNNDYLVINATNGEISYLRRKLESMHEASFSSFIRAHIPIVEYHNDSANDAYDDNLLEVYQMLYDLGNKQTREHIKSMGILDNHSM
ncbi:hydrolase [Oceanobacillus senegalensis]|uniref:hydrolase n=1 Tax=Oceanobacillus senegalensis TaxID=1936063 RepID=UPI000A305112|nr:hydrolase [Oceanobacillus senegalensis]